MMPFVSRFATLVALAAGLALVVAGVWMFSMAAALILAGVLLVVVVVDLRDAG